MSDPTTPDRPNTAGMYDAYLGGDNHSPADRAAAERVAQLLPEVVEAASANEGFLLRAVRAMVARWGIRQFVDIDSGPPAQRRTHEVAAAVAPDSRVVYVDPDPRVVALGREHLAGATGAAMVQADARAPEVILGHPETRRLVDLTAPVGLLLVPTLCYVSDDDDPWGLLVRYLDALPSGSYLALSHGSADHMSDRVRDAILDVYAQTSNPPIDRTRTEIERFFKDLEIVPPYDGADAAVTFAGIWGAEDPEAADTDGARIIYAAVARKP